MLHARVCMVARYQGGDALKFGAQISKEQHSPGSAIEHFGPRTCESCANFGDNKYDGPATRRTHHKSGGREWLLKQIHGSFCLRTNQPRHAWKLACEGVLVHAVSLLSVYAVKLFKRKAECYLLITHALFAAVKPPLWAVRCVQYLDGSAGDQETCGLSKPLSQKMSKGCSSAPLLPSRAKGGNLSNCAPETVQPYICSSPWENTTSRKTYNKHKRFLSQWKVHLST